MRPNWRIPRTLWLILAVALALRLLGAWRANLIFDERANIALAEKIDFRVSHFHLVSQTVGHPLLSIYVMKFSGLLFGTSDLGLRLIHLLVGTATVVPTYYLGRRVFGERAGLWAAALLAVDQFHVSWSRVVLHEGLLLFFSACLLLQFLRLLENGSTRGFVLLGILLGLAYLSKETALLLIPVLWIYLLITPQHRRLLRQGGWYLAHGVFLAVIAPDVIWNLARGREGYLYRDVVFATGTWMISAKPFSLYAGELFRVLISPGVLDKEYEQGNLHACYWPTGLFYFGATMAALGRFRDLAVRLMLVTFFLLVVAFVLLPGGERFDPFWWASISLIPAVLAAGWVLDRLTADKKVLQIAALLLLGYLGVHSATVVWRPGPHDDRATVDQFVADFLTRADANMQRGNLREAESRFLFMLNIGGANADAYCGLGAVALERGQVQKAETLTLKSLDVKAAHQKAKQQLKRIRQGRCASKPEVIYP